MFPELNSAGQGGSEHHRVVCPVVDIGGDGDRDIVVAGKPGLFLFENLAAQR